MGVLVVFGVGRFDLVLQNFANISKIKIWASFGIDGRGGLGIA